MNTLTEYGVVLVIVTLVGLISTIIGPIVKLTKAITKLTVVVDTQEKTLRELTTDNRDAHKRLWEKNGEQDDKLGNHESRIVILEHTKVS